MAPLPPSYPPPDVVDTPPTLLKKPTNAWVDMANNLHHPTGVQAFVTRRRARTPSIDREAASDLLKAVEQQSDCVLVHHSAWLAPERVDGGWKSERVIKTTRRTTMTACPNGRSLLNTASVWCEGLV